MGYKFKPDYIMDKHSPEIVNTDHSRLKKTHLVELLARAKNKDKSAIGEICRRFDGMVINLTSSFYIEGYTLEDMVQEGRLSLIKSIYKYNMNSKCHFSTYAAAAIKKNFYCKIRSNVKKYFCCSLYSVNRGGDELVDTVESEENIEEEFIEKQQYSDLWRAVRKLSEEEKSAIVWYYIWEISLKEYAVKEKIPYRTAAARKKRAVDHLRSIMNFG